jgi:hypothetical protein
MIFFKENALSYVIRYNVIKCYFIFILLFEIIARYKGALDKLRKKKDFSGGLS